MVFQNLHYTILTEKKTHLMIMRSGFHFHHHETWFQKKNRSHVNTPPRIRIPESPSNWCMLLTWDLVFFWNLVSCYETRFHNARVFFCSHRFIMVNSPLSCLFTNCHFALGRISLCTLCGPQSPFALFIGHELIILLLIQNNNIIILWLGDN